MTPDVDVLAPILGSANSAIVIICIAHVRPRDGVQDQENAPMSPDPFPSLRVGSGNETTVEPPIKDSPY